ncbi:ThuA domain-containing protein [Sphingomonas glacialis]|uniref:ThuA domain-containing protein n=2 Tax=Sphingomonas glacialis TaxID=658225 RepID=A0A502FS71_9SPHN|nr:ThuA domain-containing protein [Sphingomonas glacialis]
MAAIAAALLFHTTAASAATTDCPLRDAPFSVDSPLLDVLLSPAAHAIVDRETPTLINPLPLHLQKLDAAAFAAILTLRIVAKSKALDLTKLDAALRAEPVTPADRHARCARYDDDPLTTLPRAGKPALLIFQKITGFRDGPSVDAGERALRAIAARKGWTVVVTDRGGAMTAATLNQFDAVVWNNVSGDVLTLRQRAAFRQYIEQGGGFIGIHGAGGDLAYFWDWYTDTLLGARFKGHPTNPSFRDARVQVDRADGITRGLPPSWSMNDEWYSFFASPRATDATVLLTLDETSYAPVGGGASIAMGDHPIAWKRCLGEGRVFYSAIGHRPETYADPNNQRFLEQSIAWAAKRGTTQCRNGREVPAQ